MPTVPPEPANPVTLASHQYRQVAESFGVDPERYDRTRPRYPDALVERIVAASPGPEFLDVGCGTGIAARQFRAAGGRVLGVEPDGRMADFARRTGIEVETATFEAWDSAGRTFDAVVVTVDAASTVRLVSAARSGFPGVVAAIAVAIADSAAAGTWPT